MRLLRYDFFLDIKLWLPVWTGSKGQIGVTFLSIFFDKQRSVQWCKNCEFTYCGCWDMIFLNIKLWFIVIRYLMTSSWRHKCWSSTCYVLSTCQVSSSCEFCKYVFFGRQSITKKNKISICFCRLRATNSITVPPAHSIHYCGRSGE